MKRPYAHVYGPRGLVAVVGPLNHPDVVSMPKRVWLSEALRYEIPPAWGVKPEHVQIVWA